MLQNSAVHLRVHPGELDPVVDTFGLPAVIDQQRTHRFAGLAYQGQHVSQVQLTLIIGRRDLGQRGPQDCGVEDVGPGVDLGDLPLSIIGVAVLDDAAHQAVGVAQNSSVSGRVGNLRREDGDSSLPGAMLVEQRGQGLTGEHRHITQGHDHVAVEIGKLA